MKTLYNVFRTCSTISLACSSEFRIRILKCVADNSRLRITPLNYIVNIRNMSQKSITSFFKITPKKTEENESASVKENGNSENDSDKSPIKDITEKPSKSQTLDHSDGEMESVKTEPDNSSEKKNKRKRQRIESSGSETESKPEDNERSRVKKCEGIVKTYSSPKSKKTKVKLDTSPVRNGDTETKIKKEKLSPKESKKEIKRKSPSPVTKKGDVPNGIHVAPPEDIKASIDNQDTGLKTDKVSSKGSAKGATDSEAIVPEEEYDPAKPKYHPVRDASWASGRPVPYLALARTLEAVEGTSARLKMVHILANYFRSVLALTPDDLLPSVYLCLNQLAPAHHSLELGIAETYLQKAVGQCTGRTVAQVRAAAQREGDLGRVAQAARQQQRTMFQAPPLTVRAVFLQLRDIARTTGHASVNKKIAKIQSLYVACRHSEARYLIRCLEGKLRIGLAEQSVLQALGLATAATLRREDGTLEVDAYDKPTPELFKARVEQHAAQIKRAYAECPEWEVVAAALVTCGVHALRARCSLAAGTPTKPMLAHPTRGVHEIFDRFEGTEFTCEWKYDGERAQIHVPSVQGGGGEGEGGDGEGERPDYARAAIFSRNQENNTSKYPDVVSRLPALLGAAVRSCVLDCEAVAYDVLNKKILPFQVLSTRKRKEAAQAEIKVQVCVFVFDLLLLNGRSLVREPLRERRRLLREHFNQVEGEWQLATSKDCSSMEEVQQFLEEAVRGSCEGLMVKGLDGDYDIATRSRNWLKLKKDYLEGVGDTIDAVVIGAYKGRGKRSGLFGGFLLACRDAHTDHFQSLCKIGTGFSDEDLKRLTDTLQQHVIDAPRNYYEYDPSHVPDAWVAAARVWEVRCADLSLSPAHRAAIGLVDNDKGISLRFPRFIREREDKTAEQATSAQQIADMYLAQDQVRNQQPTKQTYADDYY